MAVFLKSIREFFWPRLEGDVPEPDKITEEQCKFPDEQIEFLMEIITKHEAEENARKNQIESKASIFIGTFSVAVTILLSLMKDFLNKSVSDPKSSICLIFLSIALVVITIIYLCRAILYSISCLSKRNYWKVGFPKYLLEEAGKNEKEKRLLISYINGVRSNQNVINGKVDDMNMAQKFFKRAVVCVIMLTLLMLGKSIYDTFAIDKIIIAVNVKDIIFIFFDIILLVGEVVIINRLNKGIKG